jgi:hypothetical protein
LHPYIESDVCIQERYVSVVASDEYIAFKVPCQGMSSIAETLAKINANAIIDYSTAAGIKLYNTALAKLPVTFDITSTANLFCDALTDCANKSGWYTGEGNILMIPDALTTN